jgi:hypothetical protein
MNPCTFSTLEEPRLYSICLPTRVCRSHQLYWRDCISPITINKCHTFRHLLSYLNIFLLLHDDPNRTNERTPAHFQTLEEPRLYSICPQTCICRSQLHNLSRSVRLHFSHHHTKTSTNAIYFASVRFCFLSTQKTTQSLSALLPLVG